jgi:hypothetical protein
LRPIARRRRACAHITRQTGRRAPAPVRRPDPRLRRRGGAHPRAARIAERAGPGACVARGGRGDRCEPST